MAYGLKACSCHVFVLFCKVYYSFDLCARKLARFSGETSKST